MENINQFQITTHLCVTSTGEKIGDVVFFNIDDFASN